jgi:hypothetical protein
MVSVLLEGGLGSQMFGYAAGRRLALAHGVDLTIDTRLYRSYDKFQPELHHFDVQASFPSWEECDRMYGPNNEHVNTVEPRHYHVDAAILDVADPNAMLIGNAISEDYFFDVVDVIRRDFTRVSQPVEYARMVSHHLSELAASGKTPVAVHVRRGDKALDPGINHVHGVATVEYYETAMALMDRLIDNPWYIFFSDGPEWVEANLRRSNAGVMRAPAGTPAIEDMLLMAECHHHILGNSTYSWWSAWLAEQRPDHVVIGPRPLMADRSYNTEDVLLRNWISLGATERATPSLRVKSPSKTAAITTEPSSVPSVGRLSIAGADISKLRI